MRLRRLIFLALFASAGALAGETVEVCYNYGCLSEDTVLYSDEQLRRVETLLGDAGNPTRERALLGVAIGWLLGWAGQQTPISADRGGNLADGDAYGRMDCIDHATTTTRLLRLLERRGALRFHRVLAPAQRTRWLMFDHHSALIGALLAADDDNEGNEGNEDDERFVVDSWFVDNGQPAAVMPLDNWRAGEAPAFGETHE